jgi:hypothetical protein
LATPDISSDIEAENRDVLHCNGVKDVKIYNTSQLCVATEGSRSRDVRDALAVMWGEDPVHPSRD